MNKAELVAKVAKEADCSKAQAEKIINATFKNIRVSVKKGEFRVPDFGTFKKTKRAARQGRNPQTGAPIKIAASNSVSFKIAKKFKEEIN